MIKHLLTTTLFLCICLYTSAQIIIGSGTSENQNLPIEPYYGYSYTQTIYPQSAINSAGMITTISYYYSGTSNFDVSDDDIQIYMLESPRTSFTSTSDWEPIAGMTQVFNGSIPAPTTPGVDEWIEIDITDFNYTNTNNLIIAIDANEASYNSSSDDFHCTEGSAGQSIYHFSDSNNADPASPPTANGFNAYYPNIILGGIAPSPVPNCSTNNSPISGSTDNETECGGEITLTWNGPSSGIAPDSYEVYFGTSTNPPSVGITTDLFYNLDNLLPGTMYYYNIIPLAAGVPATGCSENSFMTTSNDSGSGGSSNVYYFANNNNNSGQAANQFSFDDPLLNNHTQLTEAGLTSGSLDDGYWTQSLPFSFQFYGVEYSEIFICTNGYITFGTGQSGTAASKVLGSTDVPNNVIAACMMDLDDRDDGQIFYHQIDGSTIVITWYHYHDYGDDAEYVTFQLILQNLPGSDNDVFEIRYNDTESSATIPDILADAVIGCQDIEANASTEYAVYRQDGNGGPMLCSPLSLGFAPTTGGVSLPLDLLSFDGEAMDQINQLRWSTINEVNTATIHVEKLMGSDFREIGVVEAKGFSSDISYYEFTDKNPEVNSIYRLKMVDLDGSYSYSESINITRETDDNSVAVYPNPFSSDFIVDMTMQNNDEVNISILDVSGKLIYSQEQMVLSGSNKIGINLTDHQAGIYLVSIKTSNNIIQKRIVKN